MSAFHLQQVVLQPTSLCNLNCSYCYVPNRRDAAKMTPETLEAVVSKTLRSSLVNDAVEFLWHAGEPLTAGLPHYELAVRLIEKYARPGLQVVKSIQTNGTLVDDAWSEFFVANKFSIGLSVDGPAYLHDASRVDWAERPSHARVMAGYRTLARHGIRPGAICVLRRESLRYPDEIFDFFVQNGFRSVGFNVEEVENRNLISTLTLDGPGSTVRDEYRLFAERLYELWLQDPTRIAIREFVDLQSVIGQKLLDRAYIRHPLETQPLAIVTVQKNGDMSTFSPEFAGGQSAEFANFVVGNINQVTEIEDVLGSPIFQAVAAEVAAGIDACSESCMWFDLCGGAYTSNKFFEHGSLRSTETTACLLHRQTLADVVLNEMAYAPA